MKHEIIGILGGMGPYAGFEFCKQILDNTPAKKDWEHIHTIVDNNVKIPSRTRHILYGEENPSKYIIESINKLADFGATKVFLPCNSVHYFYEQVSPYIKIPWINLIEVVSNQVKQSNKKKPLVLGAYTTVNKKLYDKYLNSLIYLSDKDNELIFQIIEEIKINQISKANDIAEELIEKFQNYDFDSIILACTELTLVDNLIHNNNFISFDSNNIYVKYLIETTKNELKHG
ncbi:amino acid racemase [Aliarcobacter skirrowii]|uniref:aspartate/glutamate racemase family protein n=1 Tax=Aliarcobacter skirrowii TaxID=28200 RepID=UPI0029ACC9B5|nr:amino acid racemase [Aliarcobacter skirrowii]MDX4071134.1 amino acid racemase [Aliarcobacter skirrowii]